MCVAKERMKYEINGLLDKILDFQIFFTFMCLDFMELLTNFGFLILT